ncbi:MAG: TonB-dependent receptor [Gemmatimonadaceae bacterium]
MRPLSLVRWIGLTFCVAALSRTAVAQTGKITGRITDAVTGQPLEGVQAVLQGTGRGAATDASGRYFLVSVPPGRYTVLLRRIGYQTQERTGVQVLIDVTLSVDAQLSPSASTLGTVRVQAQTEALIQPGTTASSTRITADEISALPVNSIAGVLALQPGFLSVPIENTDVTAFVDERRGVTSERIRGGRAGETLTLIDGIPLNNYVLGGAALDLGTEGINQISYERGGFEPQYGNAMSGIVNIATKEGTPDFRGALSYSSSRIAGRLGSIPDDRLGLDLFQGFASGPLPGTDARVRWIISGRQNTGAQRALQFDQSIFNPFVNPADLRGNVASAFDLFPGWRGVGFNAQRDLLAKITGYVTPTTKLSLGRIDYQRQYQDYNQAWVLTGFNLVDACKRDYPDRADFCQRFYGLGGAPRFEDIISGGGSSLLTNQYTIQGSTKLNRNLTWANFEGVSSRTSIKLAAGRLYVARNTCDWLTGICLGDKIRNYTTSQQFVRGRFFSASTVNAPYVNPGAGSENFAGGDTNTTLVARTDVQSQITDHHNVQGGALFQQHDIRFYEAKNLSRPFDASRIGNYTYGGRPWDAGLYFQDKVEYDFLTLKLGIRFDYTKARGRFFANPLDPTNGTTAFEVCEGKAFGTQPYQFTTATGQQLSGIAACSNAFNAAGRQFLLDSARKIAFQDDFAEAPIRKQFSPRIGVQFPVTERSSFFVNYGVYTQNPIYNVMYQGTGIGRVSDSVAINPVTRDTIRKGQSLEGTPLGPNFRQDFGNVPVIGNPQLQIEKTTAYEVGYLTEIGTNYALHITGFAKDQSGLSGFRRGGVRSDGTAVLDPAATYDPGGNPTLNYLVFMNTDFQTVRGLELILRRRLADHWAYDLKYAFQQVITNAAPAELEVQKVIEGDVRVSKEIRSEIDQPHLFTGVLRAEWGDEAPAMRFGRAFRNARITLASRVASGFPYTPCYSFFCDPTTRGERNAGTAPPTWTLDLLAEKRWISGNLHYGAFVQVANLLDRKNCVQVFPSTGQCNAGSLNAERELTGPFQNGTIDPNAIAANGVTTTQFDFPNMYGQRRSILSGLRVSF